MSTRPDISDTESAAHPDLERAVLGAMIERPDSIDRVTEIIGAEAMYAVANREIFAAVLAIYEAGQDVDEPRVVLELERRGKLEKAGGEIAIRQIVSSEATVGNVVEFACQVRDDWNSRRGDALIQDLGKRIRGASIEKRDQMVGALEELEAGSRNGSVYHRETGAGKQGNRTQWMGPSQLPSPMGYGGEGNRTAPVRQSAKELRETATPTTWVVDQILPLGGVGLIAGSPGIGKTWLGLDLAYSVASGEKWVQNFDCRQGKVLVVLGEEDANSLIERLDLVYNGRGYTFEEGDDLPVEFFVQQPVRILDENNLLDTDLEDAVRDFAPSLVIIDPMRRVHTGDENDSRSMSALFAAFRQLSAVPESLCSILVVHHLRKRSEFDEGLERLRGSSDIAASCDSVLEVSGDFSSLKIRHAKSKRGPAQDAFLVRSEVDEDGARLKFVDSAEKAQEQQEEAKAAIVQALEDIGSAGVNNSGLAELLKPLRIGKNRIGSLTKELADEGIIVQGRGARNAIINRLASATGQPSEPQGNLL